MSDTSPRSTGSPGFFLVIAMVVVIAAALFASTRAKPPVIYAAGFGLALGFVLRFVADGLNVARRWPVVLAVAAIVGGGFVVSFVPTYQKRAAAWEELRRVKPTDPIAIALLNQSPDKDTLPEAPPYSVIRFLAERNPTWSSPWPLIVFVGDWIMAMLLAAVTMIVGPRRSVKIGDGDANAPDATMPKVQ